MQEESSLLSTLLQAAVITFGTGGTSGFTSGGIFLTVTPWASGSGSASLTVSSDGYGANSGHGDDAQIDGDRRDEAIILTFSTAVDQFRCGPGGSGTGQPVDRGPWPRPARSWTFPPEVS